MHDNLRPPKTKYAGKVAVRNAIRLARECGIDVAGFELKPDGTVRVFDARDKQEPESLYDQMKREGKL